MRRRWYLYTSVIRTVQPAYAAVRTINHQRGRQQRVYGSAACAAPVGSLAAPMIFTRSWLPECAWQTGHLGVDSDVWGDHVNIHSFLGGGKIRSFPGLRLVFQMLGLLLGQLHDRSYRLFPCTTVDVLCGASYCCHSVLCLTLANSRPVLLNCQAHGQTSNVVHESAILSITHLLRTASNDTFDP
jgi:hypothetical protein